MISRIEKGGLINMKTFKMLSKLLIALILVLAAGVVNALDQKPSGTIKIISTEVMALIGGSKGEGTLVINGAEHSFKISGASVGASVGVQKLHISRVAFLFRAARP